MNRVMLLLAMVMGLVFGMWSSVASGGIDLNNDGSFSYQGYLEDGGEPANGAYYFRFRVYESNVGGGVLSPLFADVGPVMVTDGLFVCDVQLGGGQLEAIGFWRDFGDRVKYLGIEVGLDALGPFEVISPRVFIGSSPQALHSQFAQALTFPYTDSFTDLELDPTTMVSLTSVAGGTVLEAIAGSNEGAPIILVASATSSGTDFGVQNGGLQVDAFGRFIGVLSIADQFPVAGVLLEDTGAQEAAVLAQVSTGAGDADAMQALNFHSGTEARLGTPEYAGDFNGDVIVRNKLRVRGAAERDFGLDSPSPIGPLAYASIGFGGSVTSGTANISSVWDAADSQYEITVASEFLDFTQYAATVTVVDSFEPRVATTGTTPGGRLIVKIWDLNSGNIAVQDNFSVVIYDADSVTLNRVSIPDGVDRDKYVERTGAALIQTQPRHEPAELKKAVGLQAQE